MSENSQEWKLPKNIRQIGEGSGEKKIYVEDYVITYLNQLVEKEEPGKAILLGEVREEHQCIYIFVNGALEVDSFFVEETEREKLLENIQLYFEGKQVVGWFWPSEDSPFVMKKEILEIFEREFPGENQILLVKDIQEEETELFMMEDEIPTEQPGYYIYYDKNDAMQTYMISNNEGRQVDAEEQVKDDAIKSIRKIIKNKKNHLKKPELKIDRIGKLAGGFLMMTVMALGITVIYNYDRMKEVEKSLSRLTDNVESQIEYVTDDFGESTAVMLHIEETEKESATDLIMETTETEAMTETEAVTETAVSAPRASYMVKVGDTLADICKMYYGSLDKVGEICALNGIVDENTILPGQKILLP